MNLGTSINEVKGEIDDERGVELNREWCARSQYLDSENNDDDLV